MRNNTYYKKQKQMIVGIIAAVALVVILICGGFYLKADKKQEPEEEPTYIVTVYKSLDGLITSADPDMVQSEDTSKLLLEAHAQDKVILNVLMDAGKAYAGAEVLDDTVTSLVVSEQAKSSTEEEISFTMPESNVTVSVNYQALPEPTPTPEPTPIPESKRYNISVGGVTDEILKDYDGAYDETKLVNEFGNYFGMSNPDSKYYSTYRITFTAEPATSTGTYVGHYVYLNDDTTWRVLTEYNTVSQSYSFTDEKVEPTATPTPEPSPTPTSTPTTTSTGGTTGYTGGAAGYSIPQYQTVETSFDVNNVSTVFLQFVGSESGFYDAIAEYVFSSGLTGQVVGTFGSYEIDPETDTARFTVSLSTGGSIDGSFSKEASQYTFSGL